MLVLSRRETEKVVFPSLGIAIEIVRLNGNKVRLGIDAPPEIRILRAELADQQPFEPSRLPANDAQIENDIEAIRLAIRLAQNQLRHGLASHADDALDQAAACLKDLETRLLKTGSNREMEQHPAIVREQKKSYQVRNNKPALPQNRSSEVKALTCLLTSCLR